MTKASSACKRALVLTFRRLFFFPPQLENDTDENVTFFKEKLEAIKFQTVPFRKGRGGFAHSAFCCSTYCAVTLGKH